MQIKDELTGIILNSDLAQVNNDGNIWKLIISYLVDISDISQVLANRYENTDDLGNKVKDYLISNVSKNPFYNCLLSMYEINDLHEKTSDDFLETMRLVNNGSKIMDSEFMDKAEKYSEEIQKKIDYNRDYLYDYLGTLTLKSSYLQVGYRKGDPEIVERPQHAFMRIALTLNENLDDIFRTYDYLSQKKFIFGTPTMVNAGKRNGQMCSCYVLFMDDTIEDIYATIGETACISKNLGGIGMSITAIRGEGSYIKGCDCNSKGIIPVIKQLGGVQDYILANHKSSSGRKVRKAAIAVFCEPWHWDIFKFCEIRKNNGSEDERARNIFNALWIPDLFMERVASNSTWTLFSPNDAPELAHTHNGEFRAHYERYEKDPKVRKRTIQAQDLWFHIMSCLLETGTPYVLFKDRVNGKTNHNNLGTIKSSNLCCEVMQFTDKDHIAVCNLGSLSLPNFVITDQNGKKCFDHKSFREAVYCLTRNVDTVISKTFYPTEKGKRTNLNNRPLGIGIQGLADLYAMLGLPFNSPEAVLLNREIAENLYFSSLEESIRLGKTRGVYPNFQGSHFSMGKIQTDLWNKGDDVLDQERFQQIKEDIQHGCRNSLLTAQMPTVTTATVFGNNEGAEPFTSNLFVKSTIHGDYLSINKWLVKCLMRENLWTEKMRKQIILNQGSVQNIPSIPEPIKRLFQTSFEMKQKDIVAQAVDRGPFIDQSESLNVYFSNPDYKKLTSLLFDGWRKGLKTGIYYLRGQSAIAPVTFGIDIEEEDELKAENKMARDIDSAEKIAIANAKMVCTEEVCTMCAS